VLSVKDSAFYMYVEHFILIEALNVASCDLRVQVEKTVAEVVRFRHCPQSQLERLPRAKTVR